MAWIKMRTDLARDPAVIQLADRYGWEEHVIVGLLHKLWSWADEQVTNGNAPGVTRSFIDRYLGVTDFSDNLEKVGWLSENTDGIVFPHWERHMGQSAKTRAVTALRVGKHRCNAPTVTKTLPDKIREDEIREDTNGKARASSKRPTIEEIADYALERTSSVDPGAFLDYQVANGWKLSNGNPMKCWKATFRNWERRDAKDVKTPQYNEFGDLMG